MLLAKRRKKLRKQKPDSVIDIDASAEGSAEQEKTCGGVPVTLQAASQPLHYGQSTVALDNLPTTTRHTEKTGTKRPAPAVSQGASNDDRTSPGETQEIPCTSLSNEGGYPSSRPSAAPASPEYIGSTLPVDVKRRNRWQQDLPPGTFPSLWS